jgi:hypothetical protein
MPKTGPPVRIEAAPAYADQAGSAPRGRSWSNSGKEL